MTDEKPSVIEALSRVMGDVQAVGKESRNSQQGYAFRGVDAVMNAVGPALRRHGVVIVPEHVETHYRDAQTTSGKATREVTVVVTYRAHGPAGDSIVLQAPGEALDVSDKGTPKAMSVAYRTALLQALTIPTDEPDPDAAYYERAGAAPAAPPPSAVPSEAAMRRMFALASQKLGGPEGPFKNWLAATHSYTGSRKDLSGAQVAWIIDELSKLPDHQEGETPNESR